MGCFGGSNGFGSIWWIIILIIILLCFCNDGFGGFSNIFGGDDCEWLVCLATILLILFLCNDRDHGCD